MAENETVIIQVLSMDGRNWMDYSRCTMGQARMHIAGQRPGKYRGVDWITREVVLPPTMTDAHALARGQELVNRCTVCGSYGYSDETLRQIGRGAKFDPNPTHQCVPQEEVHTVKERWPDSMTFNLGHNEQMQLGICVSAMAEVLRNALADSDYDPGLFVSPEELEGLSIETLAFFEGIFNLPGRVTLTKDGEE